MEIGAMHGMPELFTIRLVPERMELLAEQVIVQQVPPPMLVLEVGIPVFANFYLVMVP
jgi:hypothetical protein